MIELLRIYVKKFAFKGIEAKVKATLSFIECLSMKFADIKKKKEVIEL
jgi:hypothetical protein